MSTDIDAIRKKDKEAHPLIDGEQMVRWPGSIEGLSDARDVHTLLAEIDRLRESERYYHQRRDSVLREVGRGLVRESRTRHLFLAANKRKRGCKKTAQIQSENILETGDLVDRLRAERERLLRSLIVTRDSQVQEAGMMSDEMRFEASEYMLLSAELLNDIIEQYRTAP